MGRKKSVIKIPANVKIKCPHCNQNNQVAFTKEGTFNLQCKKCKEMILTPINQCCLICAFSNKKCYTRLMMEAHTKNLEVRLPEVKQSKNSKIFTRADFHPEN